jgi:hypothetical protein
VGSSNRRFYILMGVSGAIVAGGIAVGAVLVFSGNSEAAPTKAQYFARIARICRVYGPQLNKVPPPTDIAIPGVVVTSVSGALPILSAMTAELHKVRPPAELRPKIKRWLHLDDQALVNLRDSLRLAREPNLSQMAFTYLDFLKDSQAAKHLGAQIGFPSPPC